MSSDSSSSTLTKMVTAVLVCVPILIIAMGAANLASTMSKTCESAVPQQLEPTLPGLMPGKERPKLLLAQDIDWPPYAFISVPPESDFTIAGFGNDFAKGMAPGCGIDVETMQTDWSECWDNGKLGVGLKSGYYHGCMTYTHTVGVRNRYAEFSHGILQGNKPAGLITKLVNGVPKVSGSDNLSGKKIVDVTGWAPTSDTLAVVKNSCTGGRFEGFTMITPTVPSGTSANDLAMDYLMNDTADAIWIYGDQAYNYDCTKLGDVTPSWECSKWSGFGTTFAYIHVGMFGHVYNGTTLTLSKKGSGLKEIVDPCIEKFMQTEDYYKICKKHSLTESCYPNSFFPNSGAKAAKTWEKKTSELTTTCAEGYCPCPAAA